MTDYTPAELDDKAARQLEAKRRARRAWYQRNKERILAQKKADYKKHKGPRMNCECPGCKGVVCVFRKYPESYGYCSLCGRAWGDITLYETDREPTVKLHDQYEKWA